MNSNSLISGLVFLLIFINPVLSESKLDIFIKEGMVSVDLVDAEFVEVLKEFSKAAETKILVGEGVTTRKISLNFTNVSLQKCLKSIIGQNDFTLEYIGERLSVVRLFNMNSNADEKLSSSIRYDDKTKLISFLDFEGNVFKEIILNPCQAAIFHEWDYLPSDKESKDKHFILVSSPAESRIDEEGKCIEDKAKKLAFYDNTGRVLWEKDYGYERAIDGEIWSPSIILTKNGERVITTTSISDETEEGDRIYVYDKKGREVIIIPEHDKEEGFEFFSSEIEYSSNGKYCAVELAYVDSEPFHIFYDLEKGISWESAHGYSLYSITNDGIVNGNDTNTRKEINIDLKEYLE